MIKYKLNGGASIPIEMSDMEHLSITKKRFLILDRDGTLVPYSPTPELAFLPPLTKKVLSDIIEQNRGQIAIISARGLKGLKDEFDADKEILAGNYGLEISFPSGHTFIHPAAIEAQGQIAELAEEFAAIVTKYPQLILDNHTYSLCLHNHLLPPHQTSHVAALIEALKTHFSSLTFHDLPTSFEVVPSVKWDKSSTLDQIEKELALKSEDLLYLTFGDSEADEPMYAWTNARGGMSFNVGGRDDSQAAGRVDTPDDVYTFLRDVLDMKIPAPQAAAQ
jgi:trehalose 6-phosphate synthase/phosphatase